MKYLEDLIKETEEVNIRFEESKGLILSIVVRNELEKLVYKKVIKKYNITISSVLILVDFLRELNECEDDDEIAGLMIRCKE